MGVSDVSKRILLGRKLRSAQLGETLLPKRVALPVFASDALSSVAYAPDEVFIMLSLAGASAYVWSWKIAIAVALVMAAVIASYRQTVHAYPSGGGDYEVATVNLGVTAGKTVASALLVDYILTVAVSTSAGVANLGSVVPFVADHKVGIALSAVAVLTALNLRGLRESGTAFAIPTYAFMVGNGGPITSTSSTNGLDTYGMLRTSYVFGGKGPYRNDAGIWVWFHNGQRKINQIGTHDIKRWGVGGEYGRNQRQTGGYSIHAGYMHASGWILAPAPFQYDGSTASNYAGPALGAYNNLTQWTIYPGSSNTSSGVFAQGGYFVAHNIELQLRYDEYSRLKNNPALQRDFKTWTVGAQYYLTKNTRLTLNYAIQKLTVPHPDAITNPVQRNNAQAIARSMGNRLDLQLTAQF